MKVFSGKPWPTKVIYVDENNVALGWDDDSYSQEQHGHGVFSSIPTLDKDGSVRGTPLPESVLEGYSFFSGEHPTVCMKNEKGHGLAFRIGAQNKQNLYVVIYNFHNGYNSHGFIWGGNDGEI